MHRFFLTSEDIFIEDELYIRDYETLNHMVKVLRVQVGERVECVLDQVYIGEVTEVQKDEVRLFVSEIKPLENESKIKIDLFQCLPKGPKLEYIIQKNVELGVRDFYLVESARCVTTWKGKDSDKKVERYEKIAKEAAKQSKRDQMPTVYGVLTLDDMISKASLYDAFLVLYENEDECSLKRVASSFEGASIAIIVGPEGGFDGSEIEKLSKVSQIVTLGKRILRTETAGLVAVTCLQYAFDELGC